MKKLSVIFALVLCCTLPVTVRADARIVDVDFNGLVSVTEAAARSYVQSIEGTTYSAARVSEDVKKLYKAGIFSNVKVDKSPVPGGVKLVFSVAESQTIGKLTIKGNKKIKDGDLTEALKVREGDVLDEARIAETKRAVFKLYEDKGYYLADIETRAEPFDADRGEVELVFAIHENQAVKIRRIKFIGNRHYSDRKLRKKMKTKEKGFLSFVTSSGKYKDEKLSMDLQRLRYYYLDNGYLRAKVDDPDVTLSRNKRSLVITVPVHEGVQYKVSGVAVAGDILTSEQELLSKMKLKAGEIYRKSLELEDVQALQRIYGDQAYAFANPLPQIDVDDATREARVTYYIQKGPKVKINRIIIKGNRVTRDKVIRREMRIFENSYYSQSGLEMSRTRLMQLGYFEDINISTPGTGSDNRVDVVVDVKERQNTGSFSIGAGFSTLESFIFTASVQKENFFGRGWSGGVSANLSKLRQDFMVQMNDRYFLDSKWQFGFQLMRYHSALNQFFDENRFGGNLKFGREIFDFFNVLVGYQAESVSVSNFSSQVPAYFQQNASGITSAVTTQMSYDRRDNRLFTTKGLYNALTVDYSDRTLGASNRFMRLTADSRFFIPLPKKIVFKGRGYFGYINSLDNTPVGLFDRFFLGGVNTLRGFNINTVGPSLRVPTTQTGGDTAFVYGGNKSLMFNAELELPIYAPAGFQAVAFVDTGNAYGETENIDISKFRSNYGFGFRWQSPFGPLRFEWGFPIDKRAGESSTVFNFTIGESF
jgi:outer membrane protein insertion porin family